MRHDISIEDIATLRKEGKLWKEVGEHFGLSVAGIYLLAKRKGYIDPEDMTRYKRGELTWEEKRRVKVPCLTCGGPCSKYSRSGRCIKCFARNIEGFGGNRGQQKIGSQSPH